MDSGSQRVLPFSGTVLHDGSILELCHRPEESLVLGVVLEDGGRIKIEFFGVNEWELSPFRLQNIILDVYSWTHESAGIDSRCDELSIPEPTRELLFAGHIKLFEIDPSVGMGGYVAAKDVKVTHE